MPAALVDGGAGDPMVAQTSIPDQLAGRMEPGERLIWWDRPIPALLAWREVNVGLLFGFMFFAFSIFWISMASRGPGPFALFGVPFVGFGAWMVSAPMRAYLRAGRTIYGLTDRRVITLTDRSAISRPLEHLHFIEDEAFADGSGHVLFVREVQPMPFMGFNGLPLVERRGGFVGVPEANRVFRAVRAAMEERRGSRSQPLRAAD
jgi:hypothetical protein